MNEDEITKLKRLDSDLKNQIIGQDEAVDSIVKTLIRSRLSVIRKNKPIGSFLFLGPSGVGKTYLAKLIAKTYFGDESAMIRFDMSEFMEKFSVSKLIGSPAGYVGYDEGGGLTEAVKRKPYAVVLLDEIEKPLQMCSIFSFRSLMKDSSKTQKVAELISKTRLSS